MPRTKRQNTPAREARSPGNSVVIKYLSLVGSKKRDRVFFTSLQRLLKSEASRRAIASEARRELKRWARTYGLLQLGGSELSNVFSVIPNPCVDTFEVQPDYSALSATITLRTSGTTRPRTVAVVRGRTKAHLAAAIREAIDKARQNTHK